MRCKTSCGKTRPHTTTLASICAYCATNHCQCPAYGNMEHDQHYGRESSPEVIARFAHEAEQLDYDAVWALERLLRPVKPRSAPFPGWTPPAYYANVYDPIETLTFVATKTRRIKLGTSVIDALFHVPVMLARRLATLDHFSAGR